MSYPVQEWRKILQNKTKYCFSEKWYNKVVKMSDNQVIAVYLRMKAAGEILS